MFWYLNLRKVKFFHKQNGGQRSNFSLTYKNFAQFVDLHRIRCEFMRGIIYFILSYDKHQENNRT